MKYFWNVTWYRWRHQWRQRRHILKHGYRFLVVVVLERWTFFCFLCFLGQESHSNYCQLRDLYTYLETGGHVMVYVTFVISACICPTALNFFLFRKVFRSRNSFQLLPFAWPSRVTLKLKVMSWSTWLLLSLLLFVVPRWMFCCFLSFLGQENHSFHCRLRDLHAWPWNWRSSHGLRDFC